MGFTSYGMQGRIVFICLCLLAFGALAYKKWGKKGNKEDFDRAQSSSSYMRPSGNAPRGGSRAF
jgi:hypothetical protein